MRRLTRVHCARKGGLKGMGHKIADRALRWPTDDMRSTSPPRSCFMRRMASNQMIRSDLDLSCFTFKLPMGWLSINFMTMKDSCTWEILSLELVFFFISNSCVSNVKKKMWTTNRHPLSTNPEKIIFLY